MAEARHIKPHARRLPRANFVFLTTCSPAFFHHSHKSVHNYKQLENRSASRSAHTISTRRARGGRRALPSIELRAEKPRGSQTIAQHGYDLFRAVLYSATLQRCRNVALQYGKYADNALAAPKKKQEKMNLGEFLTNQCTLFPEHVRRMNTNLRRSALLRSIADISVNSAGIMGRRNGLPADCTGGASIVRLRP